MTSSAAGETPGIPSTALVEAAGPGQASGAYRTVCSRLEPAEIWVLGSAFFSATGWVLSFFGELNRIGYIVALALAMGGFAVVLKRSQGDGWRVTPIRARRFRRALPRLFLLLAILSF